VIVHVIDNLDRTSGGPPAVVSSLVAIQAARGQRVAVICAGSQGSFAETAIEHESWTGLGVECIQVGPIRRTWRSQAIERALDRISPDLVHLHCVWDPVIAEVATRAQGVPLVLSTHGMLHPHALRLHRFRKWAYLRFHHQLFRKVRAFLALNREEASHVRHILGVHAEVVPNGVDTEALAMVQEMRMHKVRPVDHDPILLNIGRLHEIKGLDRLIRAFAGYVRAGGQGRLVIAGPDGGARVGLCKLAHQLLPEGYVQFPGPVWGHDKFCLLANCSAFAHAPRFEGFGIAVAEAIGAGIPTVTTNNCHLDGAREAGALVEVDDTDTALERGIRRVLEDEALRDALSTRGFEWVRRNLGWESIAEQTLAVYRKASG
jgi:glycosyltransferase involved in cell wall biosynthesis